MLVKFVVISLLAKLSSRSLVYITTFLLLYYDNSKYLKKCNTLPKQQGKSLQCYSCTVQQKAGSWLYFKILFIYLVLEVVGSCYPYHKSLHKLEVSVFQIFFYDPFFDCRLSLRAVAPQRALSLFLRSLCSVPGFPSSLLLGTKQITFLLFFLMPHTYLILLNNKCWG